MIIDTDDYAASGIKVITFSGGEPHVQMDKWPTKHAHIFAKIRNANDLLAFLAVCDSLEHQGVSRQVFAPYLPGARQDRVQLQGAFTADLYAWLLSGAASKLTAVDVHSSEAKTIFRERMENDGGSFNTLSATPIIKNLTAYRQYDFVVAADAGATSRATEVAEALGVGRILQCTKSRDPKTGAVMITVPDHLRASSRRGKFQDSYLIPDDICDGGATFVAIADRIKAQRASVLDLFVTHGIFSKSLQPFVGYFRNLFTTDSFYTLGNYVDSDISLCVEPLLPYYTESLVQP